MSLHSIRRCSSKASAAPSSFSAAPEDGVGEAEVDYMECRTMSDRPYMIEWVNENWAEAIGDTCYHPIISVLKASLVSHTASFVSDCMLGVVAQ